MNITDTQLKDLKVLIFDCQATHSDPARGDVFEAGWLISAASEPSSHLPLEDRTETHLVKTPRSKAIPGHIQKITGLQTEDFRTAANPEDIWLRLLKSAKRTASKNEMSLCPTVIHFARYEEPFLRSFYKMFSPESEFPFLILCTHEIIRRLLPELPRKGWNRLIRERSMPSSMAETSSSGAKSRPSLWTWPSNPSKKSPISA